MQSAWIDALIGGALIGISASFLLFLNGRVAGISGIFYGLSSRNSGERGWRLSFLVGLISGGFVLRLSSPQAFGAMDLPADGSVLVAGLLVGFGTVLGSGCTSGHGVCGISRLSPRSLVATGVFVGAGILTVAGLRGLGVFP